MVDSYNYLHVDENSITIVALVYAKISYLLTFSIPHLFFIKRLISACTVVVLPFYDIFWQRISKVNYLGEPLK